MFALKRVVMLIMDTTRARLQARLTQANSQVCASRKRDSNVMSILSQRSPARILEPNSALFARWRHLLPLVGRLLAVSFSGRQAGSKPGSASNLMSLLMSERALITAPP